MSKKKLYFLFMKLATELNMKQLNPLVDRQGHFAKPTGPS